MRREATVMASVFTVVAGICAACSSTSSSTEAGSVAVPRPDAGSCVSACCELPLPGTTCTTDAGTTCAYAVTCPEGLVLSRAVSCESGQWMAVNDCPAPGAVDARGCPAAQPVADSPCALDGGSQGPCGYSKTCEAKVCDGGDCQSIRQSAQATCVQGTWRTTALGPC